MLPQLNQMVKEFQHTIVISLKEIITFLLELNQKIFFFTECTLREFFFFTKPEKLTEIQLTDKCKDLTLNLGHNLKSVLCKWYIRTIQCNLFSMGPLCRCV